MILSLTKRGTDAYRAPELAEFAYDKPGIASKKSDIWALGCILFNLATTGKETAFKNDFRAVAFRDQLEELPQLNEHDGSGLSQETMCPELECVVPIWKQ